jgi:hypothetical protein
MKKCHRLSPWGGLSPYNKCMKKTTLVGPFGALRPLDLKKTSEAKLLRYHCYGWMDKVDGQWVLNERGLQLFYYK